MLSFNVQAFIHILLHFVNHDTYHRLTSAKHQHLELTNPSRSITTMQFCLHSFNISWTAKLFTYFFFFSEDIGRNIMQFSKRRQITTDPRWNAQRFYPSSTTYYLICGEEEARPLANWFPLWQFWKRASLLAAPADSSLTLSTER